MAADLEQLVLTISADTRQMQRALQRLVGDTNTAAKQVDNAFGKGGAGKGLDSTAASATKAAAGIKNVGAVTADAGKLARFELINLSRQIQDVGVSLIGGQSPFTVLAQQGSQIADIFGSSKTGTVGGAIKQIGSGLVSVITPMRLLAVGTAAAGAAGYLAYQSWKTFTLQLDDTARIVGTTTGSLSKLQAAASFKGIDPAEFTKGIQGFGQSVYEAQNNMGSLAEVMRANNQHASTFDDYLAKAADLIQRANGDTQKQFSILNQVGLPATMEWVRLLSGGSAGLQKLKDAAAEFAANDDMIKKAREFDEAWNKAWTNFGLNARSAFQRAIDAGSTFFDKMDRLAKQAGNASFWNNLIPENHAEIAKSYGITPLTGFDQRFSGASPNPVSSNGALADALSKRAAALAAGPGTIDPNVLKDQISKQQQYLGLVGQTMTAEEARRQVDLQVQAAALNGVTIDGKRVEVLKKLAEETLLGITAIKSQADAYRTEAQTAGMSLGQATAYTAAQNALNEARRSGRALTQDNIASINAEAKALGAAADAAARARVNSDIKFGKDTAFLSSDDVAIAQQLSTIYGNDVPTALASTEASAIRVNTAFKGLSSSIENDLTTGLTDIVSGAKSAKQGFADLASSIIRDIEQMIIKMAIVGPLMRSFQTGFGALGIGSLFGGASAPLSILPALYASGGYTGPGGKYQPAGIVHRGEYVMDAASTRRLGVPFLNRLRGFADGGFAGLPSMSVSSRSSSMPPTAANDSGPLQITVHNSVDARGADQAAVTRLMTSMDQLQRNLPKQISSVVKRQQTRGVIG